MKRKTRWWLLPLLALPLLLGVLMYIVGDRGQIEARVRKEDEE